LAILGEDLFFYMSALCSVVIGVVILAVLGISKITNVGLASLDFYAVAIALFLIVFREACYDFRKKFLEQDLENLI
jgi:hypothetical protein